MAENTPEKDERLVEKAKRVMAEEEPIPWEQAKAELRIAELVSRVEQLANALGDILDVTSGWTRPMDSAEKLAVIHDIATKALNPQQQEEEEDG